MTAILFTLGGLVVSALTYWLTEPIMSYSKVAITLATAVAMVVKIYQIGRTHWAGKKQSNPVATSSEN
jgi:hypothetical protein